MKSLIAAAILSTVNITAFSPAYAEIAVIVHPSNSNVISTSEIERIFLGKVSNFSDGSSAIPLNLGEENATRDEFNTKVLKRGGSQLKAYWSKMIFTGKGQPPKELADDAAAKAAVASNPNAISYIKSSSVDGGVKVIASF